MDWVPISESSNMAACGWLFLVLTISFCVCYGKKKVTKEVKKKTYIIVSSQELKSFLKMLTCFGDEFESDAHLSKIKTPHCCSIKLKMTSLPAN